MALVTTSDFGSLLQMFSSLCALGKGDGAEAYICAVITGEKGIYMKKKDASLEKEQQQRKAAKSLLDVRHRRNVNHLSDPERIEFYIFIF